MKNLIPLHLIFTFMSYKQQKIDESSDLGSGTESGDTADPEDFKNPQGLLCHSECSGVCSKTEFLKNNNTNKEL